MQMIEFRVSLPGSEENDGDIGNRGVILTNGFIMQEFIMKSIQMQCGNFLSVFSVYNLPSTSKPTMLYII